MIIYTVQRNIIANKKPTTINDNLIQKEIGIVQFFPIVYSRNSKKKRKKLQTGSFKFGTKEW